MMTHASRRIGWGSLLMSVALVTTTAGIAAAETQRAIDPTDTQRHIDSGDAARLSALANHYAQQGQARTLSAQPLRGEPRPVVANATLDIANEQRQTVADRNDGNASASAEPMIQMRRARGSAATVAAAPTTTGAGLTLPEFDNPMPAPESMAFAAASPDVNPVLTAQGEVPQDAARQANNHAAGDFAAQTSSYHQGQRPQQYERIVTSGNPAAFGQTAIPAAFGPNVTYRPVTYHHARPTVYYGPYARAGNRGYTGYYGYPYGTHTVSTTTVVSNGGYFRQTTTSVGYPRHYSRHHHQPVCHPAASSGHHGSSIYVRVRF